MFQLIFVYLLEGINMRKRLPMMENGRLTGMMAGGIVRMVVVGICTGCSSTVKKPETVQEGQGKAGSLTDDGYGSAVL
jgi:hypothetical protein